MQQIGQAFSKNSTEMEGGCYSSDVDHRGRSSKVQIEANNQAGPNYMLSNNATNNVDIQQQ